MQVQTQYRRRRARHPSRLDRVVLATISAALVLLALSWWHFQLRVLSNTAVQSQSLDSASTFCESHFGQKWLESWNATRREVCHPPGTLSGHIPPSSIRCGSPDPDTHLPPSSAPHVFCDVTNLWLDPSKTQRARCPLYRPGYLCSKKTYHRYSHGAWAVACQWPELHVEEHFSKDHMQDIFGGMAFGAQELPGAGEGGVEVEELPTLIVTREVNEHANVFHAMTDLLNVYITLEMMGWVEAARQVLILDAHPPASLDLLWPVVAAGGGLEALAQGGSPWGMQLGGRRLVARLGELKAPVLLRHAAFVPPGYSSLLFAHLFERGSCGEATSLFRGFRDFVLKAFGLTQPPGSQGSRPRGGSEQLMVRLVSRKPSLTKRKMARQIANEEALVEMLERVAAAAGGDDGGGGLGMELGGGGVAGGVEGEGFPPGPAVEVSKLDLGSFPLPEQLGVVSRTDVLIGMHGAALAFALLLPPHAAVIELWPKGEGIWRCYEHMSLLRGLLYRRLANADPTRYEETQRGDRTVVDVAELQGLVQEVLPAVRQRKQAVQLAASVLQG